MYIHMDHSDFSLMPKIWYLQQTNHDKQKEGEFINYAASHWKATSLSTAYNKHFSHNTNVILSDIGLLA